MRRKSYTPEAIARRINRNVALMVTHSPDGASYGTLSGRAVTERKAREIQYDLFVQPNEDGLFPGFTQTWTKL